MTRRLWLRAAVWLLILGPFFFATYNFANFVASQRASVPVIMFGWERYVPFLAWTIFPYWSTDLLYALSLFVCRTKEELDLHGKRLIAIQVLSTACFLLFPLRCGFERPAVAGWAGDLFQTLRGFDQPFNQAPSLHVSLAVILWVRYRTHLRGVLGNALAAWLTLAAISAMTTHQHQFIDLPTGLWAGLVAIAALPERRAARPHVRLSLLYLAGTIVCVAGAFLIRGAGWLLLWPGFSLWMVAAAYWTGDPAWLAKGSRLRAAALLPYTLFAWINSRLWTRNEAARNHLADQVWIGRAPSRSDRSGVNSIVNLTAELPFRSDARVPILDLTTPSEEQLDAAVEAIGNLAGQRPTLVCCALGYSRSAIASAAWLIAKGDTHSAEEALARVSRARPQIVVGSESRFRLQQWADRRNGSAY
jgi:Dual specificity phosphatase, catalytic domain